MIVMHLPPYTQYYTDHIVPWNATRYMYIIFTNIINYVQYNIAQFIDVYNMYTQTRETKNFVTFWIYTHISYTIYIYYLLYVC